MDEVGKDKYNNDFEINTSSVSHSSTASPQGEALEMPQTALSERPGNSPPTTVNVPSVGEGLCALPKNDVVKMKRSKK